MNLEIVLRVGDANCISRRATSDDSPCSPAVFLIPEKDSRLKTQAAMLDLPPRLPHKPDTGVSGRLKELNKCASLCYFGDSAHAGGSCEEAKETLLQVADARHATHPRLPNKD